MEYQDRSSLTAVLLWLRLSTAQRPAFGARFQNLDHARLSRTATLVVVVLATFLVRAIGITTTYDVFIDEITYLHIARNVADTLRVSLYGEPFYLHPPAFFFLEAGYLRLFQVGGTLIEQIYSVRYLNAAIAGLTAAALYAIARRLAGWRAGLLAVLLFALDPFPIKMNSLNLLDTSAIWWVLLGYWILFAGQTEHPADWTLRQRLREMWARPAARQDWAHQQMQPAIGRGRAVAVGLSFGLALLTKDMTAFLTILPLAACFALGWCVRRRDALRIMGVTMLTYAAYLAIVLLAGQWPIFAEEKLSGVYRLVGLMQTTGVNREGGPSLLQIIWARLEPFGSTYAVMALGAAAVVYLLVNGRSRGRLLGLWAGSAYALLAYSVLFGTLEEQFFYLLLPTAALATTVTGVLLFEHGVFGRRSLTALRVAQVLVVLFLLWGTALWFKTHTRPDNGYERVLTYIDQNISHGATVGATSETAQFLLKQNANGPWGSWHTVDELLQYCPDYLMVSTDSFLWNFGKDAEPLLAWTQAHGEQVFEFTGRDDNHLVLYRLDCQASAR